MAIHAGREVCQLKQGTMISTQEETMATFSSINWWSFAVKFLMGTRCHPDVRLQDVPCCYTNTRWQQWALLPCGKCTQVEGLLCLVTELWEEVSRLRSIRECVCVRETTGMAPSLPWDRPNAMHDMGNSLSSLHLAEHSHSRDRGQWQHVPA